jgi:dipeptidyl aminopeptidase/acylaminoacyl peptidase
MMSLRPLLLSLILLCAPTWPRPADAQDAATQPTADGYQVPAQAIVDVIEAPPPPGVVFSPDASRFLLVERPAMPSIAEVSADWVGLAGLRIVPEMHSRRLLSLATSVRLRRVGSTEEVSIQLPAGARIAQWMWSPDSRRVALLLAADGGLELWLANAEDGSARRLATGLNGVLGNPFGFVGSGTSLWLRLVPADLERPQPDRVPSGPSVQETSGSSSPLRTYQDLLASPADEALFAYLVTSQLALVQAETGLLRTVGSPAMFSQTTPSPDGSHFLIETLEQPFSYVLPVSAFASRSAVWDANGKELRELAATPLGDNIPMEGVPVGPRMAQWRSTAPATLVWAEAQDGGDPAKPAELRDIWYALEAPFVQAARPIAKLQQRARSIDWLQSSPRFLVSEYDRDRRWARTWLYAFEDGSEQPSLLEDRSVNDRYGDPGSPVTVANGQGEAVVYERDNHILRAGPGHSPRGPRPFLARVALADGQKEMLWQSATDRYESMVELVSEGPTGIRLIYSSESATEPANYWHWTSADSQAPEGVKLALTEFADPTPQLRGITQELLSYKRADGVPLSGTLYLPADYQAGSKLPLLIWAYPLEYNDTATAGQVTNSTTRVLRMRGATHLAFLLAGYAVLDNATMPIVGDPATMNETFIEQIVAAAQAAIDACVARGVADADHVIVGGHSYGAFMTANLLAHCDLFRAGIARSGAYNRSLTPFGFQSERRTLWEARDTYIQLSPFFVAHRIDEPLLMIHGEKDSNPGTFPIQSERLYAAIKGNGGTARLVVLPGEDHGYQARESVLHTLAEMVAWSDRFVRPPRESKAAPMEASSPR